MGNLSGNGTTRWATCQAMAPRDGHHRHAMGNIGTRGHLDMGNLAHDNTKIRTTLRGISLWERRALTSVAWSIELKRGESQWIVVARPLCHLQYPVSYLSHLQRHHKHGQLLHTRDRPVGNFSTRGHHKHGQLGLKRHLDMANFSTRGHHKHGQLGLKRNLDMGNFGTRGHHKQGQLWHTRGTLTLATLHMMGTTDGQYGHKRWPHDGHLDMGNMGRRGNHAITSLGTH